MEENGLTLPEVLETFTIPGLISFIEEDGSAFYNTYLANHLDPFITMIQPIGIFISLLFIAGIVYAALVLQRAEQQEQEKHKPVEAEDNPQRHSTEWEVILEHASGANAAEWRLAIIEADRLLDRMLATHGYRGNGVGERLRQLSVYDLRSLEEAWEAHKVRNTVAHEGLEHQLTQRETRRVLGLYETVLRELGYFT